MTLGGYTKNYDVFEDADFEQLYDVSDYPDFSPNYQIIEEIKNDSSVKPGGVIIRYFVGIQILTKEEVFIKQIKISTDQYHEYFYESYYLSHLSHQNIISTIECLCIDGYGYIIEPYAIGTDLLTLLLNENIDLDEETLLAIVYVLLKTIAYFQSQGFTHNDIKAENIVFLGNDIKEIFSSKETIEQSLKLIDFASGRERNSEDNILRTTYPSPEYVNKRFISISYDIWSLGEMIYYLVTLDKPFIYCNFKEDYLQELQWAFYPRLRKIVQKMLIFDFHRRPSALDLLREFFPN